MNKEEREFDEKMKHTLKAEYTMDEIKKEKLWNQIEGQLDFKPKRKKKHYWKGLVAAAAACAIIGMALQTEPGLALMHNVREIFVAEKEMKFNIEGMEEDGKVVLNESPKSDYVIYIDEERYKMVKENGEGVITTKEPLPEQYPEVFMKISHKNSSVEETVASLENEIGAPFEQTEEPIHSYVGKTIAGSEWDSEVNYYYVVSDEKEGSYVIHQRYFMEAAEGHGARFSQMLKEFHIVEAEE